MPDKDTKKSDRSLEDYGVIYLSGSIDQGTSESVCKQIIEINLGRTVDCIQMIINSPGGSVSDGFAVIDMMAWSRLPVRTTGLGMLASMALLIFMAGERGHRVITPRVSILSHRYSWWVMGKHSELIAHRKEEDLVHARIVDHYLRHTSVSSADELHETLLADTDTWCSAEDAVRYGIADVVEGRPVPAVELRP
jgi:ATP-dependent Clp protease protease subunit